MKPVKTTYFVFLMILLISTPSIASTNSILLSLGTVSALVSAASSFITGLAAVQAGFSPIGTFLTATSTAILSGGSVFVWMVNKLREH